MIRDKDVIKLYSFTITLVYLQVNVIVDQTRVPNNYSARNSRLLKKRLNLKQWELNEAANFLEL